MVGWLVAWLTGWLLGWLEFNVPFQHKYGWAYITDEHGKMN